MVKCYIECGFISLRSLIVQTFNKNKLNLVCFRPKADFCNVEASGGNSHLRDVHVFISTH